MSILKVENRFDLFGVRGSYVSGSSFLFPFNLELISVSESWGCGALMGGMDKFISCSNKTVDVVVALLY